MHYIIRQMLTDLVEAMSAHLEANNFKNVRISLLEDVLNGGYRLTSNVCLFTLATFGTTNSRDPLKDIEAWVEFGNTDPRNVSSHAFVNPKITLPLTAIDLNDSTTFDGLAMALATSHPYQASVYLRLFSLRRRA